MEYRIEELARAAGVAVDTIRFYQGKGLLDAPRRQGRVTWYSEEHRERLGRIRELQQRGFTLTVIQRFLTGELEPSDEALVAAVTAPAAPETISLDELSARSGVPPALLGQLEQAGLLVPVDGGGEPRFPGEDVTAVRAGLRILEAGVPLPDLIDLARRHAACVEATSRDAVDMFDRHVRERIQGRGGNQERAERQLLQLFGELLDASATLVRHHFQRTLLRTAREHIERRR